MDEVGRFLPFYSSIHRGTGFKSRVSTEAYERAREIIGEFVGADQSANSVIFGKNTTEAINKLSYRLPLADDAVVITTMMEHHSNDLPWRGRADVVHVAVTPEGRLDEDDFDRQLEKHSGRIALVAVSGASNVTGFIQPIHELARKTHEDMKSEGDREHIDFVAISAHKMYAPFGTGALIGPNDIFMQGAPEYSGGGTVDVVTADEVEWAGMPDRDEAGTPNVVGALAMAVAARVLMDVGMDQVAAHEQELVKYTLERLGAMKGITIYGETDPARASEKVGAIPFNMEGVSHFLVAAILGYEAGVGVRSGCFCAHPYVVHLLKLSDKEAATWRGQLLGGDKSSMPGMIRMSFGCYNNIDDIDRLLEMLERIAAGNYQGDYQLDISNGEYLPANYHEPIADYLPLGMHST
jgi:selenocysteine lyase/cysteine desulfurase